jgi:hypothetical protein
MFILHLSWESPDATSPFIPAETLLGKVRLAKATLNQENPGTIRLNTVCLSA